MTDLRGTYVAVPTGQSGADALVPVSEWIDTNDFGGWDVDDRPEEPMGCTVCGGEGFVECDDLIGCTSRHYAGDYENCHSCNGSGLAKDQTFW